MSGPVVRRINEDIEDKARALIAAMSEADGNDYKLILVCVTNEKEQSTVLCIHSDPTRQESKIFNLAVLVNAINAWFMTIQGIFRPTEGPTEEEP